MAERRTWRDTLRRAWRAPMVAVLVRGTGIAFALQLGGAVLVYASQVLLARWLGASGFGDYAYASSWAQLLAVFGALGMPLCTLKFLPEYTAAHDWPHAKGALRAFRLIALGTGALLALAVALTFAAVAPARVNVAVLTLGLIGVPFFALKNVQMDAIRSLGDVTTAYALPYVVQPTLLMLGVGALYAAQGGELTALHGVLGMLAALLIVVAVQAGALWRLLGARLRDVRPAYALRAWLHTALPMVIVDGASVALSRVDILIVGVTLSAAQTGVYAAAARAAGLVSLVLYAVNAVVAPRIAPLYQQGDRRALQRLAALGTLLSLGLGGGMAAALIVFATPLLRVFGAEFVAGRDALIILALGHWINAASGPLADLLHLTAYQRTSGAIALGGVALTFTLSVALIPRWGIQGAASATALAMLAQNAAMYVFVRRKLGVDTLAFWRLGRGAE